MGVPAVIPFSQGGLRRLDITFEQFVLVAVAMKPNDLSPIESNRVLDTRYDYCYCKAS